MRPKLSLILTLFAWLLATGSHWDMVQTFAWGRMIADYCGEMSLSAAVKKTFSADTMCPLCHAVSDAKKSADGDGTTLDTKSLGKIVLVCPPVGPIVIADSGTVGSRSAVRLTSFSRDRAKPPSPPPRGQV